MFAIPSKWLAVTLASLSWSVQAFFAVPGSILSNQYDEKLAAQGLLGAHFGRPPLPAAFDYVVLGGGTAGLAMARRLAANNSVAVIEAGGFYEMNNGNLSQIPAYAFYYLGTELAIFNPLIDWNQHTTPQQGYGGRSVVYESGRTFGGGSARNQMWYHRGSNGSYQQWADAVGDDSYLFENVLPYYKRSVHFNPPINSARASNATPLYDESAFDPAGGPMQVSYPQWANPISSWAALGMEEALGLQQAPGFVTGDLTGWSYCGSTLDPVTGTRFSSEVGFLREALIATDSLAIYQNTVARRILFNGTKAVGVELTSGTLTTQTSFNITANKEVIVSAGAFRSPQLLMTSGIGPKDTLQNLGIEVISDLPGVGQNMWDHILFGPDYVVDVTTHSNLGFDPAFAAQATTDFITNGTGILTNVGAEILAFERLPSGALSNQTEKDFEDTFASDWPNVEYIMLDAYGGNSHDQLLGSPHDSNSYASAFAALVAPFSRGNVTINSTSTLVNPIISPNWLLDPRDQETAVAAFKRARTIFTSDAMKPVVIGDEIYPGLNVTTDEQILKVIQDGAMTVYHAAGTNAMGKKDNAMAVIDSKAKVYGVQGVRVVDASSFPILPPGHPQSTVYMLAEKIAQDIMDGN